MGTVFPEYLELQTTCDLSVILTCIFVYFLLYLFVIYFLIYPVVLINSHFRAENNVDIVLKMCLFLVFNLVVYYAMQKPCQLEIRIKLHLAFSLQCEIIKPIKVQESQAGFFILPSLPLYLPFVFKSIQENSADFPQYYLSLEKCHLSAQEENIVFPQFSVRVRPLITVRPLASSRSLHSYKGICGSIKKL